MTATERLPKERTGDVLAAMSFEAKIALAVHAFDAVAHLGIPPLRYTDGPNGIRGPDNVTAFQAVGVDAWGVDYGRASVVQRVYPQIPG